MKDEVSDVLKALATPLDATPAQRRVAYQFAQYLQGKPDLKNLTALWLELVQYRSVPRVFIHSPLPLIYDPLTWLLILSDIVTCSCCGMGIL